MNTVRDMVSAGVWCVAFLGVAILGSGCSAMLKVDDECNHDDDCTSYGSHLICREQLCINDGDDGNETDGPSDDGDDTDTLSGLDLLGGPCTRLDGMDDATAEVPADAIIIGSILPITGELSVAGASFEQVTTLAIEEINRAGGILGRDIIKVGCDSGTSPDTAQEAAEHLRDLGVQAVLGPFSSEIVVATYNSVLRDAGMVVVSAGANAPIISSVSAEGLIWSTSLPAAREATAMAEHVHASDWQRVAVIHRDDTWGGSMFNTFYSKYCDFSGVDCTSEDAFLVRAYDPVDLETSMASVVTELATWQPDITVAFTYIEDALTFLTVVGMTGAPLHSLLFNSTSASDLIFTYLGSSYHTSLCQMQATVQQMPGGIVYGSFLTRYRARFDGEDPVPYTAAFYDAAYLLAYAYAAASSDENPNPTGAEISSAMTRLSSGTDINAGAEDWNVGVTALRASDDATIDYVGASGDVDFPSGTGSVICPVETVRFNVGNQEIESVGVIYSTDDKYTAPDYSDVVDSVCGDTTRP